MEGKRLKQESSSTENSGKTGTGTGSSVGSAASVGRGDGGGGLSGSRSGRGHNGAVGLGGAGAERGYGGRAAVWGQYFLLFVRSEEGMDVPGVADGDGGAQQRASHGVRAGEGDGTGLSLSQYIIVITTRYEVGVQQ